MSFREIISIPNIKPLLFTMLLSAMGFGIILPLLPFYALSLGVQPFELGILTATFALMSLLFSPYFGRLSDRIGRRKVLMIGTLGFMAAYLVFAFADSFFMALLARAMEGFFAAAIFPSVISLLSDFTTHAQRGPAMGLMMMTFSVGFIFGPALGGFASAFSVRDAFFVAAAFSFLNFLWIFLRLKEPKEKEESKHHESEQVSLLSHMKTPLAFLFLSSSIVMILIGGFEATLALWVSERLGFTSVEMGGVFTFVGVMMLVLQPITGNLINRFGETRMIQAGLLFSGFGFFSLLYSMDWITLLIPLGLFVIGNSCVFPSVTSLLTKKVQGKQGAVIGLNQSFSSAGQIVGPLFAGFLFGINHAYSFIALAVVAGTYFLVFTFIAKKKLDKKVIVA
jgi:multidrug resistance protein